MLRNSIFHSKNSRSVYVNAPAWKPSLASPSHQERFWTPLPRRRGRSQPSSCSQASSLTPFISQERLSYSPLTNNPNISVAYPREVHFLLMLCVHCGPAGSTACCGHLRIPVEEEGFILKHVYYCLGWGGGGGAVVERRWEIIHWLSEYPPGSNTLHSARVSLAKASHVAMPVFESL